MSSRVTAFSRLMLLPMRARYTIGLSLWFISAAAIADDVIISRQLQQPRANGYLLGDIFVHRLNVSVRQPYTLVADSLPRVGRVSNYTKLLDVRVERSRGWGATHYEFVFRYQVINYHNKLAGTMVPAAIVSFASDSDVYPLVVEAWGFTISPFLLRGNRDSGEMPRLQPLAVPPTIPLLPGIVKAAVSALLALILLLPAAQRYLLRPWQARLRKPFNSASRALSRLRRNRSDRPPTRQALQLVHQAFDRSYAATVLSSDIDAFLLARPAFAKHRARIEQFYRWSDWHFYHAQAAPPEPAMDIDSLCQLVKKLKKCER